MATNKTTRAKRKLNLSRQTVGALSGSDSNGAQAGQLSTNQTKNASCLAQESGKRQLRRR